mmetsp:Transcript_23508/g.58379  ORF Transcript_23508/g.58379 Transcript_23508/m.58379 type:complete len:257 (+) Transcript_23508:35-805(+)
MFRVEGSYDELLRRGSHTYSSVQASAISRKSYVQAGTPEAFCQCGQTHTFWHSRKKTPADSFELKFLLRRLNALQEFNLDIERRPTSSELDLCPVALHELGHMFVPNSLLFHSSKILLSLPLFSLFFDGEIVGVPLNQTANFSSSPGRFDAFVIAPAPAGANINRSSLASSCSAWWLFDAITARGLAIAVRGGVFRLHAPRRYIQGSSVYHFVDDQKILEEDCRRLGFQMCSDLMVPRLSSGQRQRAEIVFDECFC